MRYRKYLKWIQDVFFKRNYNFDRADVDLYNFHPQILVILAIQGIFFGHRDSLTRLIWPGMSVALTLVAVGFQMMFVHHGVTTDDMSFAIECFCYLVMLGAIPVVYLGILGNKNEILSLLEDMNEDFHHVCNLGPKYREPFLESQLLIWKLCIGWLSLTGITSLSFMLFPLVMLHYQSLFATQNEHQIRPLAFPMWLPYDDPYRTPNYEVFLFLQMSFSIIFVQGFCGYIYLLFHFLVHYNMMMDMIILDFQVIFDGLDESVISLPKRHPSRVEVQRLLKKRVGRIVTWHLSVFKPLAFPMWLPYDDPYRTPNYEVFLFLQMSFSIIFVQGFCGYIYLLFHFLVHYNMMMDMIILDFQVIFDGLDESVISLPKRHPSRVEVQRLLKKRVGRIVTWHLSVFKALSTVSSAFGPPLVYQVMFSSIAICLMLFQIAKSLDEGSIDILFTLLVAVTCMQLWIPCYLGTLLRNKGFAVGDSCFNCGWHETPLSQLIRKDIGIIIFRSQMPIYIKFTGLPNIQLETFSSVMSSSYSYFNMLRQYSS